MCTLSLVAAFVSYGVSVLSFWFSGGQEIEPKALHTLGKALPTPTPWFQLPIVTCELEKKKKEKKIKWKDADVNYSRFKLCTILNSVVDSHCSAPSHMGYKSCLCPV